MRIDNSDITTKIEQLTYNEVLNFLLMTYEDFSDLKDRSIIEDRAQKLSSFASFITCRTDDGNILGMIAFYANCPPLAYITHVSVMKSVRHLGLFKRMFNKLKIETKNRNFTTMRLEVLKDNLIAQICYQNSGFNIIHKDSNNSIIMEKNLIK